MFVVVHPLDTPLQIFAGLFSGLIPAFFTFFICLCLQVFLSLPAFYSDRDYFPRLEHLLVVLQTCFELTLG